jgi:hypothetical protein
MFVKAASKLDQRRRRDMAIAARAAWADAKDFESLFKETD